MNASLSSINKFFYGTFFIVIVPFLLWLWARFTTCSIPLHIPKFIAIFAIVFGVILCGSAMLALIMRGQGLPMNAFPPLKFVSCGPYLLFAHPIYVGFSIAVYGFMAYFDSSSGFYIVAPLTALSCTALALGYENYDLAMRFKLCSEPWIGLIEHHRKTPTLQHKIRFIFAIYLYMLFFIAQSIAIHDGYLTYSNKQYIAFFTVLVPLITQFITSFKNLRKLGLFFVMLSGIFALSNNYFAALIFSSSTVILLPSCKKLGAILANSWTAWTFGPVRIINHGFYLGVAVFLSFALWDILLAGKYLFTISLISIMGLIGAGLWGQWLEGSHRLKRPFGYFGGVLGGGITLLFLSLCNVNGIQDITAALTIAFSFGQALGRLRCLVNGCCHGGPAPSWAGVIIDNPQSRAAKISLFNHTPLHMSQIYSLVYLLVLGSLLLYLWVLNTPSSLIIGLYFALAAIGRFIEEATRGEVQTKIIFGLRIYQWLSIGMLVTGAFFTCFNSRNYPVQFDTSLIKQHVSFYVFFGFLFACAFGVDFPGSSKRFSEL